MRRKEKITLNENSIGSDEKKIKLESKYLE